MTGAHGLPPGFCEEHAMVLPPAAALSPAIDAQ